MSKGKLRQDTKAQLIQRILGKKGASSAPGDVLPARRTHEYTEVPEAYYRFDRHPGYERMLVSKAAADRIGIENPFFRVHDGVSASTSRIDGREYINFSSYNYLGLAGHPAVNKAAKEAIDRYGTSASASRLVAGEREVQRELERELAENYEVEDCVVFVSGHATNVSTIGSLFGPKDLVIHDALVHNSVLEGVRLSGSARRSFPHNNHKMLDQILSEIRGQFERALIVVEGHYSMDGDIPDLPALIEIKKRHKVFLMVDEAHSLGVLGDTGKGLHEHFGVDGKDVDIWMGTLSKTLAASGGYIAGERALVEQLKYSAPGFVYSVGISPVLAAASLAALKIMNEEPERVSRLRERGHLFLNTARELAVDTGLSAGYSIVPAIVGGSLKATRLSLKLFDLGINVQPIIYPAVEERSARLRFFISSTHSEQQVTTALQALRRAI